MFKYKFNNKVLKIIALGDFHVGHPQFMKKEFLKVVDYIKHTRNVYCIGMGDMIENVVRYSVGDVFNQKLTPEEQIDKVVDYLWPIKKKILWMHQGNHEERTVRQTNLDPGKYIARMLDAPYAGYAITKPAKIKVRNQEYIFYTHHGASGSVTPGGKINAVMKMRDIAEADVYMMGHVHDFQVYPQPILTTHKKDRRLFVVTGHYVGYQKSYAQMKGYSIGRTGSPEVVLRGDRWDASAHRINDQL